MTEVIQIQPGERYLILLPDMSLEVQASLAKTLKNWLDQPDSPIGFLFADGTKLIKVGQGVNLDVAQGSTCRHCSEPIAYIGERWQHVKAIKFHPAEPK